VDRPERPTVTVDPHPWLDPAVFLATVPGALGATPSPDWLTDLLSPGATAPMASDDEVRGAVRDLLRHGGYKPTGRGKPASEYLVRAAADGSLRPINLAVDACNVVSLHSGLPISVVDADRARPPLRIGIAPADSAYVFNPAGQTIRLDGLLCLHDADGPVANAVKDSQRTKTADDTVRTVVVVWGTTALPGRCARTLAWYRDLLARAGVAVEILIAPEAAARA